jgi:uncharacterized membrane protein
VLYSTLSVIKHNHYLSGYDLSIIDQGIWKYSQFKIPISTTHAYYDKPIFYDHLELIFLLIAPIFWIINSVKVLLFLQAFSVALSAVAIYLIARKRKINIFTSFCILFSYLTFYGFQNAIWADVHSLIFGVVFLSFYIYFIEIKKFKLSLLFFFLAIFSKEDIALLTFAISFVYFISSRDKKMLWFMGISAAYLFSIFYIFFPHFVPGGYPYASSKGLLSDINPVYLFDTKDKREVIMYSLDWFGLLPLLSPLYLLPFLLDLSHYFIIGRVLVTSADGLFMHYRSSVGLLLILPTIIAISKYKKLNNIYIGIYLLFLALFFQYHLHLPLSYLSKKWFWQTPPEVNNINAVIKKLPENALVAAQSNITPHITHRDFVYTLFPNQKDFMKNSPCGKQTCRWFRIGGNPQYLIVDTGPTWDIRHFLGNREDFISGILNLEKNGNISLIYKQNTTSLYKINKKI